MQDSFSTDLSYSNKIDDLRNKKMHLFQRDPIKVFTLSLGERRKCL